MKKKASSGKRAGCTVLGDVISDVEFRLGQRTRAWADLLKRLHFQLPVTDDDGVPTNIHQLDTLREATSLYCEIAQLYATRRLLTTDVHGHKRLLERARLEQSAEATDVPTKRASKRPVRRTRRSAKR